MVMKMLCKFRLSLRLGCQQTWRFYSILLIGFIAVSVSSPNVARAESRHIIIVETMTLPYLQATTSWFRKEMEELGYADGRSVTYSVLNAQGNFDRAKELLSGALGQQKPNMVLSIATLASRASRQLLEGGDIPQVFAIVADPVSEGFVDSVGIHSKTNITGRTHVLPAKAKLEVVAQSVARVQNKNPCRIAVLRSTYPSASSDAQQLLQNADAYPNIEMSELVFDYVAGNKGRERMRLAATALVKANKSKIDGLWLAVGPNELDQDYIRAILELGVPVVYSGNKKAVEAGAMLSLLSTAEINGRSVAALADAIFKGTPAGNIPVTRPETFSVGLNIATATRLGFIIPSNIVELAEGNIVR